MATAAHTAPTGLVCGFAGVVPLPVPQSRTQALTGPSFGFLSRTSLPLPLKGEGLGIVFLGLVGSALFVQNWVTLAQQGGFAASLVSFSYPVKLIAQVMPAEQIAFIHEANTEVRKKELFSKVRTGQVRVLLGSTQKMGAGTNAEQH